MNVGRPALGAQKVSPSPTRPSSVWIFSQTTKGNASKRTVSSPTIFILTTTPGYTPTARARFHPAAVSIFRLWYRYQCVKANASCAANPRRLQQQFVYACERAAAFLEQWPQPLDRG